MIRFTTNKEQWQFADLNNYEIVKINPPRTFVCDGFLSKHIQETDKKNLWQVLYKKKGDKERDGKYTYYQTFYHPKHNGLPFDKQRRFKLIRVHAPFFTTNKPI